MGQTFTYSTRSRVELGSFRLRNDLTSVCSVGCTQHSWKRATLAQGHKFKLKTACIHKVPSLSWLLSLGFLDAEACARLRLQFLDPEGGQLGKFGPHAATRHALVVGDSAGVETGEGPCRGVATPSVHIPRFPEWRGLSSLPALSQHYPMNKFQQDQWLEYRWGQSE